MSVPGILSVQGVRTLNKLTIVDNTFSKDQTFESNNNHFSWGEQIIPVGVTMTIAPNANWYILVPS